MNDRNFLKAQTCMQQHLFEHFASEGHCSFLENVTITFIDKTDPKDPNRQEHYWRHTLKTMAPLGLNAGDDQVDSAIIFLEVYAIYVLERLYQEYEYWITIYIQNVGGEFGTLPCGRDGAFGLIYIAVFSCYLFSQKALSCTLEMALNTHLYQAFFKKNYFSIIYFLYLNHFLVICNYFYNKHFLPRITVILMT